MLGGPVPGGGGTTGVLGDLSCIRDVHTTEFVGPPETMQLVVPFGRATGNVVE